MDETKERKGRKRKNGDLWIDDVAEGNVEESEARALLATFRDVVDDALAEKTARDTAASEHLNMGLKTKVKGLYGELTMAKAELLSCRLELQEQKNTLAELSADLRESNTKICHVSEDKIALQEIMARCEAENSLLRREVARLQQDKANSTLELDLEEYSSKNRRLQSENARLEASLLSAQSREEKLQKSHRCMYELNDKLMQDYSALNKQVLQLQERLDSQDEQIEIKNGVIKRLELEVAISNTAQQQALSEKLIRRGATAAFPTLDCATSAVTTEEEEEEIGKQQQNQDQFVRIAGPVIKIAPQQQEWEGISMASSISSSCSRTSEASTLAAAAVSLTVPTAQQQQQLQQQLLSTIATTATTTGFQAESRTQVAAFTTLGPLLQQTNTTTASASTACLIPDVRPGFAISSATTPSSPFVDFLIFNESSSMDRDNLKKQLDGMGTVTQFFPLDDGTQYYVQFSTSEEAAAARSHLHSATVEEVGTGRLKCHRVVINDRTYVMQLAAERTVIVRCISSITDVQQTAEIWGEVDYITCISTSVDRYFVIEFTREFAASTAMKNLLKSSRDGYLIQFLPFNAQSLQPSDREADKGKSTKGPATGAKRPKFCALCKEANRVRLMNTHYTENCRC